MFSKFWLSTLLCAATALAPAQSREKADAAAPPSPAPDFSKEAYVVEKLYNRIKAESDGTGTREVMAEVKVFSEAGVQAFAVLNFVYTSDNELVEIDYVRVRKPDGTVVKTPDYNIQDMPGEVTRTAPLYSDIHEKHVAVKGLGAGDVLEYLVRYRIVKPLVPGQFWEEYSFATRAIAQDERLEISVPSGKYLKIVSPQFSPEVAEEAGQKIYRWKHSNLSVKATDPREVPRRVPPPPDVQVTTFTSWQDVGRWYGDLQKEPLQVTPPIQAKADELTKGLKTNDEKIRAIYSFVALKFHYIGLDFGIGRYQPHAADDVLDNGYGDCKDKHTLLASLLKAAGIDAWPALIHATRKLDPDVPSPAQFNHVITVVPQGDKFIWLDTTPEVSPYSFLMLTLRGKQALVIPTDKPPLLMTTPDNAPFPQEQSFSMEGKLDESGTFTGHAEQSYRGDAEVLFRAAFRRVPESQWKEAVQRISGALNFGGDVSNVKVTPPDDLSKNFDMTYDYVRKNYSDWENRRITPPIPPMGVEMSEDSKKPEEPVLLGGLGEVEYNAKVTLPSGYTPTTPQNVDLMRPYAEYHARYDVEDGVLSVERRLVVRKTEVELSNWEDFRDFGKSVSDDENRYIVLTHSGKTSGTSKIIGGAASAPGGSPDEMFRDGINAIQQRDFQRAREVFEQIIAKNPEYKGAHFELGLTLLSRHDVAEAINEFRKEEKVSPENTYVYQTTATYLTSLGRRDEAAEEWRKLLAVDPQNRTAASTLSGLLYDSEKYAEAADVLEKAVKTASDSTSLFLQLGNVYLKTGQNEKAIAAMHKVLEQKGDDPELLNDVAWTLAENKTNLDLARECAEKSVSTLEQQGQSASSRDDGLRVTYDLSLVWDTLGWVYFLQGDVKRAEGLVRASWLLGEDNLVGEHLGDILVKEGNNQQAARAYEDALAVSSVPLYPPGMQVDPAKEYRRRADEIKARYKKITGKDPGLAEIHRMPNGEWTKTPAEKLRRSREVNLSNEGKLSGTGIFFVVLKPGNVQSAEYQRGDDGFEKLASKLAASHYPMEFPPNSAAVLVMRVSVRCEKRSACVGSLVNPTPESLPSNGTVN